MRFNYAYDTIDSSTSCPACSHSLGIFVTEAFNPSSKFPKKFKPGDTFKNSEGSLIKAQEFSVFSLCSHCQSFIKGSVRILNGHIVEFKDDTQAKFWVSSRAYFDGLQKLDTENVRLLSVLERLVHESSHQ
jgi:hypothetical protein